MNWIFRVIALGNIFLASLRWSAWFEGTDQRIGFADRLLGGFRLSGFRADFIWLVLSIPVFLAVSVFFFSRMREIPTVRTNAWLSVIAALASGLAIYHIVFSGLLYFG